MWSPNWNMKMRRVLIGCRSAHFYVPSGNKTEVQFQVILTAKAAISMEHDQANLSQVVLILALILGVVLALMLIGVFSKMATAEFHRALVLIFLRGGRVIVLDPNAGARIWVRRSSRWYRLGRMLFAHPCCPCRKSRPLHMATAENILVEKWPKAYNSRS